MLNCKKILGLQLLFALLVSCNSDTVITPNILFVLTDDQSWLHTSYSGEPEVSTPNFDRIAREGVYFTRAYVSAPTCTASRSAILAGQHFWRLGSAAVLWGEFQRSTLSYQQILEDQGYHTGYTGKGWGPGRVIGSAPAGRGYNVILTNNPVSTQVSKIDYAANFVEFLDRKPEGAPFSFWFSPFEPHRPYQIGQGINSGINADAIVVPGFLPDNDVVRSDLADYYLELQWQDRALGQVLVELENRGLLDNTIIVASSDNGMPFPRAKSNNYEFGTRVPLAIRWGEKIAPGTVLDAIVNLSDLAPTFLSAANISVPIEMTGRNLLPLLFDELSIDGAAADFSYTVTGFERHVLNARADNATYPSRAIHTEDFAFIRNFRPMRWPAGDPPNFRDIDATSASKNNLFENPVFLQLATARRPEFELYDLNQDPYQLHNLADDPTYAVIIQELSSKLMAELQSSNDPLLIKGADAFHDFPYYGEISSP